MDATLVTFGATTALCRLLVVHLCSSSLSELQHIMLTLPDVFDHSVLCCVKNRLFKHYLLYCKGVVGDNHQVNVFYWASAKTEFII